MVFKSKNSRAGAGERGVAVLIVSLILLSVSVIFIPTLAFLAESSQSTVQNDLKAASAYYAAEGAIEDNIYRIKKGLQYADGNSLDVAGSQATVSISTSGSEKAITAEAVSAGRYRKVQAVVGINGVLTDFKYGVQVGQGGFDLNQSAMIDGNVYANGNIVGANSAQITGDAYAASSSFISGMVIDGSARAGSITNSQVAGDATMVNLLDHTSVGGSAYAANITSSQITGDATYLNIDSHTTVGGREIPANTPPAPLPVQPFAIPDEQLDNWENEAQAGGVISSPCPYEISSSRSLGPVKINCDLTVSGSAIVTVNGPIWVKGDLTTKNSAQLKLAGYFGGNSSVIVVDDPADRLNKGKIDIQNSSQLAGSGVANSYLLAVARNNSAASGGDAVAIAPRNSSQSGIFYAPYGLIDIQQSVQLEELTAYKISMGNSAIVRYESGLANLLFTSGPGAGWALIDWQEKF